MYLADIKTHCDGFGVVLAVCFACLGFLNPGSQTLAQTSRCSWSVLGDGLRTSSSTYTSSKQARQSRFAHSLLSLSSHIQCKRLYKQGCNQFGEHRLERGMDAFEIGYRAVGGWPEIEMGLWFCGCSCYDDLVFRCSPPALCSSCLSSILHSAKAQAQKGG